MSYTYTIIIPHYNIPELLHRCLWSIPKRDDVQIIVVDDKSNKENLARLKELEREYKYVDFIYNGKNGGGGYARNIGLRHAKGKYVLFADADDFFNYCINKVMDEYKDSYFDIIFFGANYIDGDTYQQTSRKPTHYKAIQQYKQNGHEEQLRYMIGEPWGKLIKLDIIRKHDIHFDEIPIHNDTKFSYLVGYYAQSVYLDDRAIYCLADRVGSVSKGISDEKQMIRTKVFSEKNQFLSYHNINIFDGLVFKSFKFYLLKSDFYHLNQCLSITKQYGYGLKELLYFYLKGKVEKIIKSI